MGALARVNAALAEQRTIGGVPWRPWDSPDWSFGIGGPVHPTRQTGGGIDGALSLQPVYSSVRILAEGVAQIPLRQYRDSGDRKVKMPLGQLLQKPSAYLNRFDWLYQYVTSAALTGTAWGLITARDGYGYPSTVEWLPPEKMAVLEADSFAPGDARVFFAGRLVPRDQLLIIRAFTIPGRTAGLSPLLNFQLLIDAGVDALSYGADWYKAGGFPPGTFQNTQWEVEKEQADVMRARLVSSMRRREPLVYGRDWEYKPISVPPNEAQFVEAMQLNATQIASIYGVPPHRVGGTRGDSMSYSNVESENLALISDTLDPWLVRFETAMADCLPQSQYAQFNRNARVRTDITTRFGAYRVARDIGLMNTDEIRDLEDLPPLPAPSDENDYDGKDYTPLAIQVAAARGTKQLLGEGGGPAAPAAGTVPGQAPAPAAVPSRPVPVPVPAVNGNGNGKRPAGS